MKKIQQLTHCLPLLENIFNELQKNVIKILENEDTQILHGYMSNSGFEDVREKVASSINNKFGTSFTSKNIIMTVGAASGLNIILKLI